jgi:hypothetical protein
MDFESRFGSRVLDFGLNPHRPAHAGPLARSPFDNGCHVFGQGMSLTGRKTYATITLRQNTTEWK